MEERKNNVLVDIDGRIGRLPDEPSSWPRIFQVPHYLRKANEEAYKPAIISIGPYHRQNEHLKAMETHKVRFLKDLLGRRHECSAQRYVEVMTSLMEKARNCYSESLSISNSEFLEMMVLDGCFIVELIHKIQDYTHKIDGKSRMEDPLLKVDQIYYNILKDLILVENQLPFFVLRTQFPNIDDFNYLFKDVPGKKANKDEAGSTNRPIYDEKNLRHLVDLLHTNWHRPEDSQSVSLTVQDGKKKLLIPSATDLTEAGEKFEKVDNKCLNLFHRKLTVQGEKMKNLIPSATELTEAGIKFEKVDNEGGRSLFDIKFENGTLKIPTLTIHDGTERLYRNFIACEQFDDHNSPQYFTEYRKVLDCLINTGKDVELLCHNKIIDNWLGSYEEVAKMINSLGTEVMINRKNFYYAKLFEEVNKHYNSPCNKRMANLRHNYFNSPWALISVLAATFLLLCTLLQTTFTIFPRS